MLENFKVPMVVRQKGLIDENLKVYVESKVTKFIKELKEKTIDKTRYAILVGNIENDEETNEDCLVINGAIQCNCKSLDDLDEYFLKQVRGYINEQVNRYFTNKKIIGLICIDNTEMNSKNERLYLREDKLLKTFKNIFKENYNLLFECTKHSESLSYLVNQNMEDLKGYFVYYDKNEQMKEYLEDNKIEVVSDNSSERIISSSTKKIVPKTNVTISGMINVALFALCLILGFGLLENFEVTKEIENRINIMNSSLDSNEKVETSFVTYDVKENNKEDVKEELQNVIAPDNTDVLKETGAYNDAEIIVDEITPEYIENNTFNDYLSYQIEKGDTLRSISRKYFGDESKVTNIKELNGIENENMIKVGQIIMIPQIN